MSSRLRFVTLAVLTDISIVFVYLCLPFNGVYAIDSAAMFSLRSQAVNEALLQGQIEEALGYYEVMANVHHTRFVVMDQTLTFQLQW